MKTTIKETVPTMKRQMDDILIDISWAQISTRYFGKSRSWLYHKMDGIDGNGGKGDFTPEEKETLRTALRDLAGRIINCAENIQ
ncbi:MAG: DUF5053 domain-containing protein [Flavobacteriaceae bacterium]|jgi:hypothetical protein|nr:DUF5053 domain-containing protein [Flavobacteriaceae bacterium]